MNNTPLSDLARRISNQEAELQRLRREFEERQRKLAALSQRKETLQAQLQQIEAESALLVTGKTTVRLSKTTKRAKKQQVGKTKSHLAKVPVSVGKPERTELSLAHLIVKIVQEAHSPLSVNEIAKDSLRRGFTSSSSNFPKMVAIRIHELRQKGVLRSANGQSGFVLGKSPRTQAASARRPVLSKANSRNGTPVGWNYSKPSGANRKDQRTSLRSVLTKLLERSKGPLLVRDLAKQALASGYRSKSKDFENVVQVTVGRMDELVNVRGKGYRLKNGKT
jgi:hypothetical protein